MSSPARGCHDDAREPEGRGRKRQPAARRAHQGPPCSTPRTQPLAHHLSTSQVLYLYTHYLAPVLHRYFMCLIDPCTSQGLVD